MEALLLPWKLLVSVLGELWLQLTEPRDQEKEEAETEDPRMFCRL